MSLVPYAKAAKKATQLAKYTPAGKAATIARGAIRAADLAYKSGLPQMAASRFKRYRKSRASRPRTQREQIGKHPSSVPSNKVYTASDSDPVLRNTRQLYLSEITGIPDAGSFNDIDNRQRDQVYLSGVKIALTLQNKSTKPLHWNCAMIMNRKNPSTPISVQDFFKASGFTRGLDFNTNLNSNDFRARFINTDTNVVLMHKRFTLAPEGSTTIENGWKSSYMTFDQYVPIKRIITYDQDTANNRVYFVYWTDEFNTAGGVISQVDKSEQSTRLLTYFKEPKVSY